MPIYDYLCAACDHQFELRQGFDADPVETCPKCQGQARRRFHSVTVIYKGSGFYTTDYARKHVSPPTESTNGKSQDTKSTPPKEAEKEVKTGEV